MATKVAGILGKKVGMTQLFDSKGDVRPVTVLQAGPCVVTQHKTAVKHGYESAQIGLVEFVKESKLSKPERGHLAKNNLPPVKFLREVPLEVEAGSDGDGAVKQRTRFLRRGPAASFCRWSQVPWLDVSNHRFDWFLGISVARV